MPITQPDHPDRPDAIFPAERGRKDQKRKSAGKRIEDPFAGRSFLRCSCALFFLHMFFTAFSRSFFTIVSSLLCPHNRVFYNRVLTTVFFTTVFFTTVFFTTVFFTIVSSQLCFSQLCFSQLCSHNCVLTTVSSQPCFSHSLSLCVSRLFFHGTSCSACSRCPDVLLFFDAVFSV